MSLQGHLGHVIGVCQLLLPGRCLGAGHRDAGTGQHRGGAARGGWARNGIPAGLAVANLIAAPRGRSVDPVRRRPQGE
jgi:hypothetical protein